MNIIDTKTNRKTARVSAARPRVAALSHARALAVGIGVLVSLAMPALAFSAQGGVGAPIYSPRALVARGDAEVAAGHWGAAIVEYNRARLLAPRSAAVAAGLARARAAAGLRPEAPRALARGRYELSPNEWSWVALAGFGLSAAAGVSLSWSRRRRQLVAAISLAGLTIAAGAFVTARSLGPSPGAAVVVSPEVVARIAPFDAAEPTFVATDGSEVEIERLHQGFALIRGPGGRGWVPREKLETILPAPPPRS